jgi:hypothetical protein
VTSRVLFICLKPEQVIIHQLHNIWKEKWDSMKQVDIFLFFMCMCGAGGIEIIL